LIEIGKACVKEGDESLSGGVVGSDVRVDISKRVTVREVENNNCEGNGN